MISKGPLLEKRKYSTYKQECTQRVCKSGNWEGRRIFINNPTLNAGQ